jgi:hypothetical protein
VVTFLHDEPAEEDFFGPHSKLASAVLQSVCSDKRLRVVGLVGGWGSGKSTVIRQLARAMRDDDRCEDFIFFEYDAWLSQNDPPRRAFIESLIKFLIEKDILDPETWDERLDKLRGRIQESLKTTTPVLTWKSVVFLKCYLALAMGAFLLNKVQFDKLGDGTAGPGDTWIAILAFALLSLTPLAMIAIYIRETIVEKLPPEKRSVVPRLLNKSIDSARETTTKQPEPSSIEFRDAFRDIMVEVGNKHKRLLIVLDNLDRLSDEEALGLWSSMRSFFVDRLGQDFTDKAPVVLVPVDVNSLTRLFTKTTDDARRAAEIAKSYIDKTFDITFRVPPPVRSDWKAFLRTQMEMVFGQGAINDHIMYFVERVFDNKHKSQDEYPTPRIINRFVNSVATTWLSRKKDKFPIAVISLFVANLEEIEKSVLTFTQREDLKLFDGDFPAWRDEVAALYFGVTVDKSRQVLLEGPLLEAIENSNIPEFEKLMRHPGAFKVFDDVVRAHTYDPGDTTFQPFAFKSAAVLETVRGNDESAKRLWRFLVDKLVEAAATPPLSNLDSLIGPFLRTLSERQAGRLVPAIVGWLSRHASFSDDEESFSLIAQIYERLAEWGQPPRLVLQGEPANVVNGVYWVHGNEVLESSTSVAAEFSKLLPVLSGLVADENEAVVVPEVLRFRQRFPTAFPKEASLDLAPLHQAVTSIIEGTTSPSVVRQAAESLGIMARLTKDSEESADTLIDAGHLQNRLNEAASASKEETVGVLAALAIARGKTFSAEVGDPGSLRRLQSMHAALDMFAANPLNALWNAHVAGSSPRFTEEALEYIVRERELSSEELDQISNNLEFYFDPLDKTSRNLLAKKIGEDPSRVDKIGSLNPSAILGDILTSWFRLGVPEADRRCKSTVDNLPIESWRSYLEGNGDWVLALLEKCPPGFKLTVTSQAVEAAVELINDRSASLSVSERARLRKLVSHFNVHAQRKLIDAIIGQIPSNIESALALLKSQATEAAASISTHLTSESLITLLGLALRSEGRAWLQDQSDALRDAINRFDRDSKKVVREWFRTTKTQNPKARATWVELMGGRLRLD